MFLKESTIYILEVSTSHVFLHNYAQKKGISSLLESNQFDSVEKAFDNISKKHTLFLLINNQHVLSQEQQINFVFNSKNCDGYIERTFSISTQDFYYNIAQTEQSISSSIIRKSYLDDILSKAKEQELLISRCYFGSMSADTVLELSNQKEVFFGDFLSLQNDLSKENSSIRKNNTYQTLIAIFLGGLVLVSALFYSFQYPKLTTLQQLKTLNSEKLITLTNLKANISKQEKLINQINKLSNTDVGNFIDQLLLIKPNSITLSQINFQPLLKKIKKEKDILTDSNTIIIQGKSKIHKDIQNWISNLESLELINSVEILSFNDLKTISEFKLAILIDENKAIFTK